MNDFIAEFPDKKDYEIWSTDSISISDGAKREMVLPFIGLTENGEKVKINNLEMTVKEFESCMEHLLELTKKEKPENFI